MSMLPKVFYFITLSGIQKNTINHFLRPIVMLCFVLSVQFVHILILYCSWSIFIQKMRF